MGTCVIGRSRGGGTRGAAGAMLVDEQLCPRAFVRAEHAARGVLRATAPAVAAATGAPAVVAGYDATAVHPGRWGPRLR